MDFLVSSAYDFDNNVGTLLVAEEALGQTLKSSLSPHSSAS
jgi:hypothetical protein